MPEEINSNNKKHKGKRKSKLLEVFLTREEPDEDYLPELKAQWESMETGERIKFTIGAVIGLLIVLGGLFLVFLLITALRQ